MKTVRSKTWSIPSAGSVRWHHVSARVGRMRAVLMLVLATLAAPALAVERVVNIYAWAEYVAPETLKKFEAATGIKVQYDTFDSADVLETKMLTGGSGYDVVFPSIAMLDRLIQAKALQPTGMQQMSTVGELDPQLLAQLRAVDPGNYFAVPYTWGTTGLAFNRTEIAKRIPNPPLNSLDLLFKPEYASQLKDCGISIIDAPQEVISIALHYLGKPTTSKQPADLRAVQALLSAVRPSIRSIATGTQSSDLANGELCLALTYSGDAVLAQSLAVAAQKAVTLEYASPEEGTLTWVDTLAIPVDAPHPSEAKAFIEFITRSESMAELTSSFFFANANLAAVPLLAADIAADPAIYPPENVRSRLFGEQPLPLRALRERTRIWANFRNQH